MRLNGHILGLLATLTLVAGLLITPACQGLGNNGDNSENAVPPGADTQGNSIPPSQSQSRSSSSGDSSQTGNQTITPSDVTVGNISMSLSVDNAQYMFDPGKVSTSDQDTSTSSTKDKNNQPAKGAAVVGGNMIKVTNNFDASQNPPSETDKGEMLRQVSIQIKDKTTGQIVPYLVVSMDLLRDGKPVLSDLGLVPLVPADGNVNQLRYGNNIRFPRKGNYQIFVRTQSSPLLGPDVPPIAQFNVSFK